MSKDKSDVAVDSVLEKYDKKPSSVVSYSSRSFYTRDSLIRGMSSFKLVTVSDSCGYPDSVTEQIHSASIAEQIRAGQGSAISPEIEKEAYDFPDGRDDGSLGLGPFDLSEPADVFEREADFKSKLSQSLSAQLRAKRGAKRGEERSDESNSTEKKGVSDSSELSSSKNSPEVK